MLRTRKFILLFCSFFFIFLLVGCREPQPEMIIVTRIVTREVPIETTLEVEQLRFCTLMNCRSGLMIRFVDDVPQNFTVAIDFNREGNPSSISMVCENDLWSATTASCREYFLTETPEEMVMTVNWDGQSRQRTFKPQYEQFRPNGDGCEPVCMVSSITFSFP